MKVLYIGATGLVGCRVVPLLKTDFELTLAAYEEGEMDGSSVYQTDITQLDSVEALLKKGAADGTPFDAVVNSAIADYKHVFPRGQDSRHEYNLRCIETNAKGAYQVFEAAWRAQVPRVVYISSLSAIRGEPRYTYIDSDTPVRPLDVYAAAKVFGEHVGREYAYRRMRRKPPMDVVCLRLGQPIWHEIGGTKPLYYLPERMPVDTRDIATAIACALRIPIQYGVFSVVSQCEPAYIDPALYEGLGYKPNWRFTPAGISPAVYPNED